MPPETGVASPQIFAPSRPKIYPAQQHPDIVIALFLSHQILSKEIYYITHFYRNDLTSYRDKKKVMHTITCTCCIQAAPVKRCVC